MEEQINNEGKKNGFSKRIIAIIVIALVVFGGSVAAYIALNGSTKTKYFSAEKATIDYTIDEIKERYEPELKWVEYTEKNAIANSFDISGAYNDPYSDESYDMFSPDQILNNSSLTMKTESDIKNKRLAVEVIANVAGMEIDNIKAYLTDQQFMLGLPFLDDILLINNEDVNKMLQDIDPELDLGEINFADAFNTENALLSEDDKKHFEKEYLMMIHDELSEDAFTSKDEKVTIAGESINAEKITMHLTEKEVKDIISKLLDKLRQDERVKELIKDQFGATAFIDEDLNELIKEFENGLVEMKEEVQHISIPDGLTSTIWVDKKLIVKRDFSMTTGPSPDDLVTLTINGEQLLQNKNQTFTYDFSFKDSYDDEEKLSVMGDLSWKDDKINDSVKFLVDDIELSYTAEETVKNGDRDFNRTFKMVDPYGENGSLIWSGKSAYEKDSMSSEHAVSLDIEEMGSDFITVNVSIDGKKIKAVDIPEGDNIKDIGKMTEIELNEYVQTEAAPKFQQWLMQLLGGGALGF